MEEFIRKLDRKFIEIEPYISIQKAFELLADPNVNILIYLSPDKTEFYYLTDREIHKKIELENEVIRTPVKDIAIISLVFKSEEYLVNKTDYLVKFKKDLSKFGRPPPDKFLVLSNGRPIGLVSDIIFDEVNLAEKPVFKSELEIFIENEDNPPEVIGKFFDLLTNQGFDLTPEIKSYIAQLLERKKKELDKKALKQDHGSELQLDTEIPSTETGISQAGTGLTESPNHDEIENGLVVTYNPNHINHRPSVSSPETPERLVKIMDLLKGREKVFNSKCRLISDYPPATEEDLLRVHTKLYIQFVKNYASKGGGFLGDSTYITKTTHELALLAIGGAIKAATEVLDGNAEFGLGLIRPPGHHASRDKYGGYCIYNNAGVLARHLQANLGIKKILILDWDAHAANGTMDIFYDDPSVMLISLHQDPHNYYPKTGFISQMGKSDGLGYTINVEMPRGSGDNEYLMVLEDLVLPVYNKFKPDFIIGCNGFDPHHSDQYTDLLLTSMGYYKFSSIFREHMRNKMIILMEGGYNPFMGELTHTLINGLLGLPNPFEDKFQSLVQQVMRDEKIQVVLNQKLKELKYNLHRYHVL